jgi:hypothetical protein
LLYTSPTERRFRHIEITVNWATHDHRARRHETPALVVIAAHWRLVRSGGRPLTCVTVRDAIGLEVRAGYSDLDLLRSERVASLEMAAMLAGEWKATVMAKGSFTDFGDGTLV